LSSHHYCLYSIRLVDIIIVYIQYDSSHHHCLYSIRLFTSSLSIFHTSLHITTMCNCAFYIYLFIPFFSTSVSVDTGQRFDSMSNYFKHILLIYRGNEKEKCLSIPVAPDRSRQDEVYAVGIPRDHILDSREMRNGCVTVRDEIE